MTEIKTAGVTPGSTMVALYPDTADVSAAIKGGLPRNHEDHLHCTLVYLGDHTDAEDDPFDPATVHRVVENWANSQAPLSGTLAGVGRFVGSEEHGDPVWVHPDLPGLPEFRQSLVQILKDANLPVSDGHGYTPHICALYVPKGEPTPIEPADEPVPVKFSHVSVAVGDVARHYRLSGPTDGALQQKTLESPDPAKAIRDAHRQQHQARLDRYEAEMAQGIEDLWKRQKATVLSRLLGPRSRKMQAKGLKADPNYSLNSVKWTAEAIQFAIKMLAQIFGLSWKATAERLGHPDLPEPPVATVNDDIAPFARKVVDALVAKQQQVVEAITAAQAEGKSLEQTAAIVEDVYANSDITAASIARSTNTGLANRAGLSVANEVGVMYKSWLSSHDERVRPTHRVADGQEVPVTSKFSVGQDLLDYPGDPDGSPAEVFSCRCTCLYAFGPGGTGYSGHDWSDLPEIPKKVPPSPRTVKAFGVLLDRLQVKTFDPDEPRDPGTGEWILGPEFDKWNVPADRSVARIPLNQIAGPRGAQARVNAHVAAGTPSSTPDEPVLLKLRPGADPVPYELADGHHRVARALARGEGSVLATVWREYDDEPFEDPEIVGEVPYTPTVKSAGLAWIDEPRDPHTGQWVRGGSVLSEIFEAPKWKPVMSRDEAEVWAKDSAIQQVGTFVGRADSVAKIRQEGFHLNRTSVGREWGDGVYMGIAGLTAKDHGAEESPEWNDWVLSGEGGPEPTVLTTLSDPSTTIYARMKQAEYDEDAYNAAFEAWDDRYAAWYANQAEGTPRSRGEFAHRDPEPMPEDFPIAGPRVLRLKVNVRKPAMINVGPNGSSSGRLGALAEQIPGFTAEHHKQGDAEKQSSTAITDTLKNLGYDALIVHQGDPNDPGFDSGTGGPQIVVFDPKNVTVIDEPYRYTDLPHKSLLTLATDFQTKTFHSDEPRDPATGEWVRAIGPGSLRVRDYEGRRGEAGHITRNEWGTVPTSVLAAMPGVRGEVPGEHRNKKGAQWKDFVNDIRVNGIKNPVFVTVNPGEQPKISEGNHRRDAAVEAGLPTVPVEIRYFGHAEQDSPVDVVPTHPHDALAEFYRPGADWGSLRGRYNPFLPTPEREQYRRQVRAAKGLDKASMEESGWTPAEIVKVERAAKERLSKVEIRSRIPSGSLASLLADGRLKNQHEVNASMGNLDPNYRRTMEQVMFGYPSYPEPEDADTAEPSGAIYATTPRALAFVAGRHAGRLPPLPEQHPAEALPIYGFLVDPNEPFANSVAGGYGDIILTLKAEVRHRTTFTGVDSLGSGLYPSPIDHPAAESLTTDQMLGLAGGAAFDKQYGDGEPNWPLNRSGYVEAQIHGGVRLSDIAEIRADSSFAVAAVRQAMANGLIPDGMKVVDGGGKPIVQVGRAEKAREWAKTAGIADWQATKPWERPAFYFEENRVPGFVYDERAARGYSAMWGGDRIVVNGSIRTSTPFGLEALFYHEAGHAPASEVTSWGDLGPLLAPFKRSDGRGYVNPFGVGDGGDDHSGQPQEILADAYMMLAMGTAATYLDRPGVPELYDAVEKAAGTLGFPLMPRGYRPPIVATDWAPTVREGEMRKTTADGGGLTVTREGRGKYRWFAFYGTVDKPGVSGQGLETTLAKAKAASEAAHARLAERNS